MYILYVCSALLTRPTPCSPAPSHLVWLARPSQSCPGRLEGKGHPYPSAHLALIGTVWLASLPHTLQSRPLTPCSPASSHLAVPPPHTLQSCPLTPCSPAPSHLAVPPPHTLQSHPLTPCSPNPLTPCSPAPSHLQSCTLTPCSHCAPCIYTCPLFC